MSPEASFIGDEFFSKAGKQTNKNEKEGKI